MCALGRPVGRGGERCTIHRVRASRRRLVRSGDAAWRRCASVVVVHAAAVVRTWGCLERCGFMSQKRRLDSPRPAWKIRQARAATRVDLVSTPRGIGLARCRRTVAASCECRLHSQPGFVARPVVTASTMRPHPSGVARFGDVAVAIAWLLRRWPRMPLTSGCARDLTARVQRGRSVHDSLRQPAGRRLRRAQVLRSAVRGGVHLSNPRPVRRTHHSSRGFPRDQPRAGWGRVVVSGPQDKARPAPEPVWVDGPRSGAPRQLRPPGKSLSGSGGRSQGAISADAVQTPAADGAAPARSGVPASAH